MKTINETKADRKLTLKRETLRILTDSELRIVAGGCEGGVSSQPSEG